MGRAGAARADVVMPQGTYKIWRVTPMSGPDQLVTAWTMDVAGGAIIFRDHFNKIIRSVGPGAWREVAPEPAS